MSYVLGFENNWQVNILVLELLAPVHYGLSQSQYFSSENSIRTANAFEKFT